MREIKFRAWNGKHMLSWDWICAMDMISQVILNYANPYQVMQCTGLRDKNGKEIYEGDWVRQQFIGGDGENEVPLDDMIFEGVVLWDYSGWGIDSMGNGEAEVDIVNNSILEVLGNIWENPELLKDAQ